MPDYKDINPTAFTSWEEAYNLAKELYERNDYNLDRPVLDLFEIAFIKGLNIESDREKFLDATRITARISFEKKDYSTTSNKLLVLITNMKDVPVWVNLYFAITQIYTNISLVAEDPEFYLFPYLDAAKTKEDRDKRNSIYSDFLLKLIDDEEAGKLETLNAIAIFDKACDYGLNTDKSLLGFKNAFGIEKQIPIIGIPEDEQVVSVDIETQQAQIEANQKIADLEERIRELEKIIAELTEKKSTEVETGGPSETENKVEETEAEIEKVEQEIQDIEDQLPQEVLDATALFRPRQKILVYGGQNNKKDKLVLHAKKNFGLNEDYFEFVLDYTKIKSHAERIRPGEGKYIGILIGESPHKTTGTEDYSSLITKFENEEGYPYTVRVSCEGGKLKMTKTAFAKALWKLIQHLQAQSA